MKAQPMPSVERSRKRIKELLAYMAIVENASRQGREKAAKEHLADN